MKDERMMEKIKKLLALASDPGAAPNEAATASRQAAFLMAEHDIELNDLMDAELKAQWDMCIEKARGYRPGNASGKVVPPWIGIIAWGVKIFTRTIAVNSGNHVLFKGPREDVVLSVWLHETLVDAAYKASNGLDKSAAIQFRNGYASALQGRLKKMAKEREDAEKEMTAAPGTGTSLVRVMESREQEMFVVFGEPPKSHNSSVKQSMNGYLAGQKAHIPTGRPIGSGGARLLLN